MRYDKSTISIVAFWRESTLANTKPADGLLPPGDCGNLHGYYSSEVELQPIIFSNTNISAIFVTRQSIEVIALGR